MSKGTEPIRKGRLIIVSAPSGSGKSTIIGRLLDDPALRLSFSVSATTRAPRGAERDGVDYYFMSEEAFRAAIAADEFAEYQEVYPGRFYGTLKREIERITGAGRNVVLDIDVLGGLNVKRLYGDRALALFIAPPSIAVLRERLIGRGTDSLEEIERRVGKAQYEIEQGAAYDCHVVNDDLDTAVAEVRTAMLRFLNASEK